MAAVDPVTAALQYGPNTAQALQHSQYLADAIRNLQESSQAPRTWGETAGKLAAAALLQYGRKKSDSAVLSAIKADQGAQMAPGLSWLDGTDAAPQPGAVSSPPPAQSAPLSPSPASIATASPPTVAAPGPSIHPIENATGLRSLWDRVEHTESRGRQSAVSPKGAFGVSQLMPATAMEVAAQLGDPSLATRARTDAGVNRQLGQAYLANMGDRYGGNQSLALAAYNAGPGRVDQWIKRFGDPRDGTTTDQDFVSHIPFPETRKYVSGIMGASGSPAQSTNGFSAPPEPPQGVGMPPPQSAQVPAGQALPPGGPGGPGGVSQGAPPTMTGAMPTAAEKALVHQLLANPRTFQQGQAMLLHLQQRAAQPDEWDVKQDPTTGQSYWASKSRPGVQIAATMQGARGALPSGMEYGQDGVAHQIKGTGYSPLERAPQTSTLVQYGPDGKAVSGPQITGGTPLTDPAERARWNIAQNDHAAYAVGADGLPHQIAPAQFGMNDVLRMRQDFLGSKDYELHTKTVNAINSLQKMLASSTGNNGLIDMSTFDNLVQAQTGLSAKQGNMQLLLSHLGFPQEVQGTLSNAVGNGFVTPDSLRQAISSLRAYGSAHQAVAGHNLDEQAKFAKQNGYDLGLTLPSIDPMPRVPWLEAHPTGGSSSRPAPPASVNYLRQHPETAKDFDARYGQDAAAHVLGSR